MSNDGFAMPSQSAYPCNYNKQTWGLTKREYFAVMALQGLLTNPDAISVLARHSDFIFRLAVSSADCLIDELNKTTDNNN